MRHVVAPSVRLSVVIVTLPQRLLCRAATWCLRHRWRSLMMVLTSVASFAGRNIPRIFLT